MCYELELSDGSTTVSSAVTPTHSPSRSAAGRKKKSKCTKGVITPKLPKFADHEEKAEFMINVFKVKLCTRRRRHTWSGCPYAHLGETAKRRDPNTHHAVPCPEMKQGNRCPRGDQCPYSHHDFEYWLHPARYCTVMCNKGKNCDRSLCFFAHDEKELRSCSASANEDGQTAATFEECVNEPRSEVHDSSSSIENGPENCAEDLKSIASLTSVTDSFRSTSDRFQETSQSKETPHSTDLCNDYPPSLYLNQNLINMEMSSSESQLGKLQSMTSETGKPLSVSDMCASANICQLLGQQQQQQSTPFGDAHFPIETQGRHLNKSLSVGHTQHLSPTCHFSGLSGEFMPANGLQTLPSCPAMFDLLDRKPSHPSNQAIQSVMSSSLGSGSTQGLPPRNDFFQCPQLTALAPPVLSSPNPHQAMDSLPRTNQEELLLHTAALQNASPASVLGALSSQDLLCNNELLELAKLIYNMQGGIQTLRSFEPNPSFFDPSCSLKTADEQGLGRDPMYSLQQTGGASSLVHSSGFFFD